MMIFLNQLNIAPNKRYQIFAVQRGVIVNY